jgi:hypothetical protein
MKHRESYKELDFKNRLAVITCLISFGLGWCLTIAGFLMPPMGEVADSILWILGQSLLYTAGVLGIGMYTNNLVKTGINGIRRDLRLKEEEESDE